jgi:hypothetical protein
MALTIDGTAGITFNNATTQASAGQVLQVVNATYGTVVSNSTNTYADTGLTASITPKFSTSKILVLVNLNGIYKSSNDTWLRSQIVRGSTSILVFAEYAGVTASNAFNGIGSCSASYLDSPATTSSTTYKVQFLSAANNAIVYCQAQSIAFSTITLMEIAA